METSAASFAARALEGHASLCARFELGGGALRRDGRVHPPGGVAHLWPFARAFVATLDVAGIPAELRAGAPGSAFDGDAVIARRLRALERYWDERGPAYASDPPARLTRLLGGGDIYYDDNAWAGLALVQLARQRPGDSRVDRALALADFARAGWDRDSSAPSPGGVFWVQQGRGLGARNHDRNAISTAPNAELILHLEALGKPIAGEPGPAEMARWVTDTLGTGNDLFRDKIRGDGTIDNALWSYNQGSMLGLHALLSERDGPDGPEHLRRAEAIARAALGHYEARRYAGEPPEFVAILMRNLLVLSARTDDDGLRRWIARALRERADAAWPIAPGATLLQHSAAVTLQALAAWDPADHRLLA
ncbi:MAG TPA: glycoside hydrolase family 76 protein [Solirubrobacteraceae bacterium]|nr:glycoside hydrolase family 76 protein [Solirubrobacteraceae bacterium]